MAEISFSSEVRLWPMFVYPKKEELLSSWLVRLSRQHGLKVQTFTALTFPGISVWNRDIDKMAPDKMLKVLSEKTLSTTREALQTTLRDYEGRLYLKHNSNGNNKWILPLGVYHRTRRNFGLLFCPQCLKADGNNPYFRKTWRLSFSIICPDCKIYLQDRCPKCESPVVFFRGEMGQRNSNPEKSISICYNCGFDLVESKGVSATRSMVYNQKMLYRIAHQGWKSDVIYPHLFFDVLYQILKILQTPSPKVRRIQQDLAARFKTDEMTLEIQKEIKGFDFLPLQGRTILLKQAFWLLDNDCRNLVFLCSYHNLTSSDLLKDMKDVPFWFQELVLNKFYVSNVNRRFEKPYLKIEERNRIIAPVNGVRGPSRKYSQEYRCIQCQSDWVIKDGNKRGAKMLKCRNCNKRFQNKVNKIC